MAPDWQTILNMPVPCLSLYQRVARFGYSERVAQLYWYALYMR